MADIRAFRGFRYDLGQVGDLSDVVAPPYDVIDAEFQQELYEASPHNAVRLELTQEEPDDDEHNNRYTRAANTLKDWINNNVLQQDTARSLYVYEQEYQIDGTVRRRRGFMARVRLEPFGAGKIFPHEQTLSGPKADRLKLYHATGFNISPIFGLYPDDDSDVFMQIAPAIRNQPPIVATDHLGVIHRFWAVTDSHTISSVMGMMGPRPIFIADGHHRYETGLKYLEEARTAGEVPNDEAPQNFCLMMLVGMTDPGLSILPTHRLVSGIEPITSEQLIEAISPYFEIVAEFDDVGPCWEHVEIEASQACLGFGTISDGKWIVARLEDPSVMEQLAPEQTPAWRELAVSVLHKLVLDKQIASLGIGEPKCRYVHLVEEVYDAIEADECQLAALVPPVEMHHVQEIAGKLEKMPPKSTYFYPKLLTGMVFNSLKKD